MPAAFYLIPMVPGPWSRSNPQRPQYVDEIRCNWTGHPVDGLNYYVCKVNTTEAKHTDLASRTNVHQMPRAAKWDTAIGTLSASVRNAISTKCSKLGIAYDSTETIGQLLQRVIQSGVFTLGSAAVTTNCSALTAGQQAKVNAVCDRFGVARPQGTETLRQIVRRIGPLVWPGDDDLKVNVSEF